MTDRKLFRQSWKRVLDALCLCLIASALHQGIGSESAMARPGDLDPSFGNAGRVLTPIRLKNQGEYPGGRVWTNVQVAMARAPRGRIAVGGERTVAVYLANGRLDPTFGNRGKVAIAPPGDDQFTVDDIAVDTKGRIVVAGTAWHLRGGAMAMIVRYRPNGNLDRSFGANGVLLTGLGLPAPRNPAPNYSVPETPPAVWTHSIVVDRQNRIVIAGAFRALIGSCRGAGYTPRHHGFVSRLAPNGMLDPTFGEGGVILDDQLAWIGEVTLDPTGKPIYIGDQPGMCNGFGGGVMARLDSYGRPDLAFGIEGRLGVSPKESRPRQIAIDRRGRILMMRDASYQESDFLTDLVVLRRWNANGTLDPSFGDSAGQSMVRTPGDGSKLSALTVDTHNRALLAGTLAPSESRRRFPPTSFTLLRFLASGRLDSGFGQKGRVSTRFSPSARAVATDVLMFGKNRVIVAGPANSGTISPHHGFALARYDLGH